MDLRELLTSGALRALHADAIEPELPSARLDDTDSRQLMAAGVVFPLFPRAEG
jgi:hypothetical protein